MTVLNLSRFEVSSELRREEAFGIAPLGDDNDNEDDN